MSNTINIVQPKAEDGVTDVSYVTRTNSIFKSDGSPLGDSMDAYMDEVDELSQSLTELADGTMPIVYNDTSKQTFASLATLETIASNMDNTSSGVAIIYNQCGIVHKMNSSHIGMIVIAYNGAIFSFRKVDTTWSYATVSVGAYTNVTS